MHTEAHRHKIVIQITQEFKGIDLDTRKLRKLVRTVCDRFKLLQATVSIAIVDNTKIQKINAQFLNHNHPTDCLSFDISDSDTNSPRLFDLVVNGERAVEQANLRGHSPQAELALYLTHCLLHNLGFDDSKPAQAKKMHDTEDEILQQLGFGLVYN